MSVRVERTDRYALSPASGTGSAGWKIPVSLTAAYALFAVAVHLRLLDSLDIAVRDTSRPGAVWGRTQMTAARIVRALGPVHLGWALSLVVATLSIARRSLRPVWVAGAVGVIATFVTLATKWVMARSDPVSMPIAHGSFPSGHAVSAVVASGVIVLLVRPGTRWGWILPVLVGCVMGSALVVGQVHPATDVIGAGLLTAALLSAATGAQLGRWANPDRGRRRITTTPAGS